MPVHDKVERALADAIGLISTRKLRPIPPISIFDYGDLTTDLRQLRAGRVKGKIVLHANPDAPVPVLPRVKHPLTLDPNSIYLLSGGLCGLGRSLAMVLQTKGAR